MIGTILSGILKSRNISVSELARLSGVPAQTLYSIIRRDNMKIGLDVLVRISSALGVPADSFLPGAECLTQPEHELLRRWRSLDAHGREVAEAVIRCEARRISANVGAAPTAATLTSAPQGFPRGSCRRRRSTRAPRPPNPPRPLQPPRPPRPSSRPGAS